MSPDVSMDLSNNPRELALEDFRPSTNLCFSDTVYGRNTPGACPLIQSTFPHSYLLPTLRHGRPVWTDSNADEAIKVPFPSRALQGINCVLQHQVAVPAFITACRGSLMGLDLYLWVNSAVIESQSAMQLSSNFLLRLFLEVPFSFTWVLHNAGGQMCTREWRGWGAKVFRRLFFLAVDYCILRWR